jgi:hypothetical protein
MSIECRKDFISLIVPNVGFIRQSPRNFRIEKVKVVRLVEPFFQRSIQDANQFVIGH